MKKFDKSEAWQDLNDLFTKLQKIKNPIENSIAILTEVPKFLESIYDEGYKDGLEEGKKIKIENISKQN
jgi:hypothetical protein